MKERILVSLLAIALVSGCTSIPGLSGTSQTTTSTGNGLEMTSFTADPTEVYGAGTVRVEMDVSNLGGYTVNKDTSHAFVYLTGSNMDLGSSSDIYWRGKESADKSACKVFTRNMEPADAIKGTEATEAIIRWNLIAPNIREGQTRQDSIIGRVYTDYMTSVSGDIWAYTESESDAAKASSRDLNKATFTSTSGPVSVDVTISPNPLVIYGTDKTTTLNIRLSNTASGTIYRHGNLSCSAMSVSTENLNLVDVKVTAPDFVGATSCDGLQELVAGRPTSVTCDLTLNKDVTTFRSFPITVDVNYGYFTEKSTIVTVQGR